MNLDFNVLVFLTGFIFSLPIIGYLFRFQIPISVFFLLAGVFMLSILMVTDGIILDNFAFLDGGTDDTIVYPQDAFTGVSDVCGGGGAGCNDIRGEYVFSTSSMLYGDTIDCIDLALRKTGTPTGLATIGVYDRASATDNPILQSFGTIDVVTLNTGFSSWYTFCLPIGTTYTIGDQDLLGLRYDLGNATDAVRLNIVTADNFDSTNTRYSSKSDATNVWTDTTTSDLTARFYLRGVVSEVVQDSNTMDFTFTGENYQLKVIMIFISIMFMVGGALVEVKQR